MTSIIPYGINPYYVVIVVVVLAVLRIGWRTIANYKGTAFSLSKTVVYAGVSIALGVLFSALSFFEGVSCLMVIPEIVIVVAAAYLSYRYSNGRISFWKTDGESLFFKGGVGIYLVYLVGFVTRLALNVAFVGPAIFDFSSAIQLGGAALYASMASDLLLTLGVGLLIGRNVRVTKRYLLIQRGIEVPTSLPMVRGMQAR